MKAWIIVFILLTTTPLHAHSWYEQSCCGDQDCKEVEDGTVENKQMGVWVKDFGLLSHADPRLRWSRDDKDHICAQGTKLFCVYRKPPLY